MLAPWHRPIDKARPAARIPAEWCCAAAFGAIGCWVYCRTPIHWESPEITLYRMLAGTWVAGLLFMFALACGHSLLRPLTPEARRTGIRLGSALALIFTLGIFLRAKSPGYLLNRVVEPMALGTALAVLVLTLFLPLAGLARARQIANALRESLGLWAPYFVYFAFSPFCLAATLIATPRVWDPVLLRMDLSLGFNPSRVAHTWHYAWPWIDPFAQATYGLLGPFVAGVAACLQIAGVRAQARRAVLASFLVGAAGLGCYQLVPAVGPLYGYPALYRQIDSPAHRTQAAAALAAALNGPDCVKGPAGITRNGMPSLHVAFTLVALAAAWNWRRRFFWACLPLGILEVFTTLLLGYHYLVDLLAAVPVSVLCWRIADAAIRATPCTGEEPLPGLAVGDPRRAERAAALGVAIIASVAGLIAWGSLAPLSPWMAWPLALVIVAAPFGASLRLSAASAAAPPARVNPGRRRIWIPALVCCILLGAVCAQAVCALRGGFSVRPTSLADRIPKRVRGWTVGENPLGTDPDSVKSVADTLAFDEYVSRIYRKPGVAVGLYWAHWNPRKISARAVDRHTPDTCWVLAGYRCVSADSHVELRTRTGRMPPGEARTYISPTGRTYHVMYWHLVDGAPYRFSNATQYRALNLARSFVADAVGGNPEQIFVTLWSTAPLSRLTADPGVESILGSLGLAP